VLFVFINRKLVNLCVNVTDQTSNPPQSLKTVAEARLQTAGSIQQFVHCVCNVMAHAQKPDFVFRHNGLVHLNRRGASGQSTTGSRGVRISGSNAGYTMFRGSVKGIGYPLHSPVSPSLPLPCVTVCHHISTGLYNCFVDTAAADDHCSNRGGRGLMRGTTPELDRRSQQIHQEPSLGMAGLLSEI